MGRGRLSVKSFGTRENVDVVDLNWSNMSQAHRIDVMSVLQQVAASPDAAPTE